MTLKVAGEVGKACQEARVVASPRLELGRDARVIAEEPDLRAGADRQPTWPDRYTHWALEGVKGDGELSLRSTQDDNIAYLVGGN